MWLWIAEGFIRNVDQKALPEDVAEGYLMDLIGRSLVMASQKGSDGRVKACLVHDMLRTLCLTKIQEENFLESITGYDKLFPSPRIRLDCGVDSDCYCPSITYNQHRLSICSKRNQFVMLKPSSPCVRSLLFFAISDKYPRCPYDISFISDNFKLLRVLDVESINVGSSFPTGIELLDTLRYLAVSGDIDSIPSTISKLWRLEIFIVKGLKGKVALPDTLWSMTRLRHLHVNSNAIFSWQDESLTSSSRLDNLVTLSSPILSYGDDTEKIMRKFPKLRKLRCTFSESSHQSGNCSRFPLLEFLTELESLKIFYYGGMHHSCEFNFPLNLKKLSLSDFILSWSSIFAIGILPKLEVLKLVSIDFDSPIWEMREDEFCVLKFLKLDNLDIVQWNAYSDHLPNLQRLVLRSCKQLQDVPSGFGEISTLQMIELRWCSNSAENSVRAIQEEQLAYGNEGFQVFVNIPDAAFRSF
ncbi:hypothetical protein ACH5RR_036121 [Cinchona calisaya]|uniref:Uncharacterized protein n=1 Tax=Cinchona calisaya TaxID=153742 RepID=A0ABD2Y2A9_9GENT